MTEREKTIRSLRIDSVERINVSSAVVFTRDQTSVFSEEREYIPIEYRPGKKVQPWGSTNMLPYDILSLIRSDETMTTCQTFNAETMYGGGLRYNTENCTTEVKAEVELFRASNVLPAVYFGCCQDMKHFEFAVVVIILNQEGSRIVKMIRKEAINCRFTVATKTGRIEKVVYGDWKHYPERDVAFEEIELLSTDSPLDDLRKRAEKTKVRKYAVLMKIPTAENMYYPIPAYGSLFRSGWYNIKHDIVVAKKAALRNHAAIKYHIEVSDRYWENLFEAEHITDRSKMQERVDEKKREFVEFLTGAENSGRALFSEKLMTPDGKEISEVSIRKIDSEKQGGDWEQDIQESVNIMCFTMGVHSNLVGSVPGKAQTNNSGSDKRELYTIAQLRQKPYHDFLFLPHQVTMAYNGWKGAYAECPLLMLTTLDEHKDYKTISQEKAEEQ